RVPDGATDLGIDDGIGGRVDLVGRPAFGLEARRFLRVRLLARQDGGAGIGRRALAIRAEQAVDGQPPPPCPRCPREPRPWPRWRDRWSGGSCATSPGTGARARAGPG